MNANEFVNWMKGFLAAPTDRSDIALEILREEVEKVTQVNSYTISTPTTSTPLGPIWRGGHTEAVGFPLNNEPTIKPYGKLD